MNTNDQLLKDIKTIVSEEVQASEKRIKQELRQEIHASEENLRKEIKSTEQNLRKEIHASQEDTIGALSELIHTGYAMHEKRIKKIEEHLELPSSQ